jgi:class 3 adenylate cyclase
VNPALAQVIATLDESRLAAQVYDAEWHVAHATRAQQTNVGGGIPIGAPVLSTAFFDGILAGGALLHDDVRDYGLQLLPFILATHPGGVDALLAVADPCYHDAIASTPPRAMPAMWTGVLQVHSAARERLPLRALLTSVQGEDGGFAGAVELWLPDLSGDMIAALTLADTGHLERVGQVIRSRRRPSAILFADLEASTPLARRLSGDAYFRLVRRIMRAVDELVVRNGGLVGRHVGDGLTAFFPAEQCGGDEGAARAAIQTARGLSAAVTGAAGTVPHAGDVRINAGVHWGDTVRLGAVVTAARFEVTALGEEVNEAARIEACATGGRVLASKAVVERLDDTTLAELGIDPDVSYEPLAAVDGAPEKARRDAPTLAVRPV